MKRPKEDPADKEARLRERRIAELDRSRAVKKEMAGLTSDIRSVYGNNVSLFGMPAPGTMAGASTGGGAFGGLQSLFKESQSRN